MAYPSPESFGEWRGWASKFVANLRGANGLAGIGGTVPADKLGTGTPSGSTFLRGDGVWATPAGGGGGGSASWGGITGTLSAQTDLQTALNGKQAVGSYAAAVHTHTIANVTGLQAALDGKLAGANGVVTVNFGVAEQESAVVSVADAGVASGSRVVASVLAVPTAEHSADEILVMGLTAHPANIQAGVGFDIYVASATGTHGRVDVHWMRIS